MGYGIEQGGSNSIPVSGGAVIVNPRVPQTALTPTSATVIGISATVVSANASRTGLVLKNMSSDNIFLAFGTTAVVNKGIPLIPFGTFEMDSFLYTLGTVNAISSGTSSLLTIQEYS